MKGHKCILWVRVTAFCATLLVAGQTHGQEGDVFRVETGKDLPHCIMVGSSPLCQVERELQFHHLPGSASRESEWLVVRFIEWIFGIGGETVDGESYPVRMSVVQPVLIEYKIAAVKVLDDVDVETLEGRRGEGWLPDWVKPGVVQVEALVAFEDAHRMRWPVDGWQRHQFLLDESGDFGNSLVTEEGPSSRTIYKQGATSECIGRPDTPLCAVETLLACRVRREEALCELVDDTPGDSVNWRASVSYFIATIDAVEDENLPSGHKYTVTLEEFDAYRDRRYGDPEFTRYSVLRSGDNWRVVGREVFTWKASHVPE